MLNVTQFFDCSHCN